MADDADDQQSDTSFISDHYLTVQPDLAGEEAPVWRQIHRPNGFKRQSMAEQDMIQAFPNAYNTVAGLNPDMYKMPYGSRVINIKTDSVDNVRFSVQIGKWSTLEKVSERIMKIWDARGDKRKEEVLFLFAVNSTKQFCGVAKMVGPWNENESIDGWKENTNGAGVVGSIPIQWVYVKNVPYYRFKDIKQRNGQPVINMWNGMHLEQSSGRDVLELYVASPHTSNILAWTPDQGPFGDGAYEMEHAGRSTSHQYGNGHRAPDGFKSGNGGWRGGAGGGLGARRPAAHAPAMTLNNWRSKENMKPQQTGRVFGEVNDQAQAAFLGMGGLNISDDSNPPHLDGSADPAATPRARRPMPGQVFECVMDANGNFVPLTRMPPSPPYAHVYGNPPPSQHSFQPLGHSHPSMPNLRGTPSMRGGYPGRPGGMSARPRGANVVDGQVYFNHGPARGAAASSHANGYNAPQQRGSHGTLGAQARTEVPHSAPLQQSVVNGGAEQKASFTMPNSAPLLQGPFSPNIHVPKQSTSSGSHGSSLRAAVGAPEFVPRSAQNSTLKTSVSALELSPTREAGSTPFQGHKSIAELRGMKLAPINTAEANEKGEINLGRSIRGARNIAPGTFLGIESVSGTSTWEGVHNGEYGGPRYPRRKQQQQPMPSSATSESSEPSWFKSSYSMAGVDYARDSNGRPVSGLAPLTMQPMVRNLKEKSPTHQPCSAKSKKSAGMQEPRDEAGIPLSKQPSVYYLVAESYGYKEQIDNATAAMHPREYYGLKAKKAEVDNQLFRLMDSISGDRPLSSGRGSDQLSEAELNYLYDSLERETNNVSPVRDSDGRSLYPSSQANFTRPRIAHKRAESEMSSWGADNIHTNIDGIVDSPPASERGNGVSLL